jgi:hypothetical protein
MPLAAITQLVDGDVVADASDDVLKDASSRIMEEHVVGDDCRHAHRRGEVGQLEQPKLVVRPPAQGERHVPAVAEGLAQAPQAQCAVLVSLVRHEHRDQAFAIGYEVSPSEIALSVAGALLPERQQPTQSRVRPSVGRIDQDRLAAAEIKPATNHQAHARGFGGLVSSHDARQRVAIDDGEGFDA